MRKLLDKVLILKNHPCFLVRRYVLQNVKEAVKSSTRITNKEGGMKTYLGIPEDISGLKRNLFDFLKDRLQNRVNGWTG